jgi:simple sugar transport system ATP-binding protein
MSVQNQLKMHDISIQFSGFSALSHVNVALIGGTTHALTGANGAGKSTLMAVLAGTHSHYQGQISINNQHIEVTTPRQARQHGVHLVQQEVDVALVPGLSVAENIMLIN